MENTKYVLSEHSSSSASSLAANDASEVRKPKRSRFSEQATPEEAADACEADVQEGEQQEMPAEDARGKVEWQAVVATILLRDNEQATVLLPHWAFQAHDSEGSSDAELRTVQQLAAAAATRAASCLRESGDTVCLSDQVLVYDSLAAEGDVMTDLQLESGIPVDLHHLPQPLHSSGLLHAQDGALKVQKFWIIVTRQMPCVFKTSTTEHTQGLRAWSQGMSLPVDPFDFVKAKFPCQPRNILELLTPTPHLTRQGREREVREIWRAIYGNRLQLSRRDLMFVYGGPGAGKTSVLRYVCERTERDINEQHFQHDICEWIHGTAVLAVTFAEPTAVSDFDLQMAGSSRTSLVPIIARLLFAQQSAADWPTFVSILAEATRMGILDCNSYWSLHRLLQQLGLWSRPGEEDQYVVLLVDDILNLPTELQRMGATGRDADAAFDQIRYDLCNKMIHSLQVVFTSSRSEPMHFDGPSNRWTRRTDVSVLGFEDTQLLFKDALSADCLPALAHAAGRPESHILAWLARLSGGHPGTVVSICQRLAGLTASQNSESCDENAWDTLKHDVVEGCREMASQIPWPLFLDAIFGSDVFPYKTIEAGNSAMTFDDATRLGYLLYGVRDEFQSTAHSRMPEPQLRVLIDIFTRSYAFNDCALAGQPKIVLDSLSTLLRTPEDGSISNFAAVHMIWELMWRNAASRRAGWMEKRVTELYWGVRSRGYLPLKVQVSLTEPPDRIASFPTTEQSWPLGEDTYSEYPPSREHPDLLQCIWHPQNDNFPVIDFVIFAKGRRNFGRDKLTAFVYHFTNYSQLARTGLPAAALNDAYETAKFAMEHAGWRADEFIFVVHTFEDFPDNALPGKSPDVGFERPDQNDPNIIVLDKKILESLYGSLEFTMKHAYMVRTG